MKKKTYVLAIVYQLNRGGLECRLMDILRKIDFEKVQIDIYTYRKEEGLMDQEAKELGCKIYYNEPLTIRNMFWYVNYFAAFLREHPQYQIIHAHQDAWCSVFCKGAYKAGVPVRIAHSRTAISSLSVKNIAKNIIKLPTRKYATHFFAVSQKAGEWLFGKKITQTGKVQIWKNAIECNEYRFDSLVRKQVRHELQISDEIIVIHVGNFTPPKNHEFIIEVFEQVLRDGFNAKMLLIGADTTEHNMKHIQKKVEEKGLLEKVQFLGMRKDVNRLLQAGDVFLFPSFFEGFPGAVLEAQAAGLPCVLSDTITPEVCLLDSTVMVSLKESKEKWAKTVERMCLLERYDAVEKIVQEGYDINYLVEKLTIFYERVGNKNGSV